MLSQSCGADILLTMDCPMQSQLDPLPRDLPFRIVSKTIGRGAYASWVFKSPAYQYFTNTYLESRKQFLPLSRIQYLPSNSYTKPML